MAGPIKIAIVTDAKAATRGVTDFSKSVSDGVGSAVGDLERANRRVKDSSDETGKGLEGLGDKADRSEARILGLKDTVDGAATVMQGPGKVGLAAYIQGWADLASGLANFVVPALMGMTKATITSGVATVRSTAASVASRVAQMASAAATTAWTGAQWLLNAALTANPIGIVIVIIIALVAAIILAWKRSETFRRIVTGAFNAVRAAAAAVWNWIRSNWPRLLAIITGPIGMAVRWVLRHFDSIKAKVKAIPGWIRGAFSNANRLLVDAGRRIVQGLWSGITGLTGWLQDKVASFISRTVPGPIRRALGIASPSRVMRSIGRFLPQGLALGMDDEAGRVRSAAGRMAAATIAAPGVRTAPGAAGAGTAVPRLVIDSAGSSLDDFLLQVLRKAIRVKGGNVQLVLGRG